MKLFRSDTARSALVTGASGGLGAGMAVALAQAGAGRRGARQQPLVRGDLRGGECGRGGGRRSVNGEPAPARG